MFLTLIDRYCFSSPTLHLYMNIQIGNLLFKVGSKPKPSERTGDGASVYKLIYTSLELRRSVESVWRYGVPSACYCAAFTLLSCLLAVTNLETVLYVVAFPSIHLWYLYKLSSVWLYENKW